MRVFPTLACSVLLLSTSTYSAPPQPTRAANRETSDAQWSVRVDVLMVAMPQDKLLPLLPDLRDPKKIDAAVDQLLTAVQRKEAILTGYPTVNTLDGTRSMSEAIFEKRYPTEFEPPQNPQNKSTSSPALEPTAVNDSPLPTAFETRNLGVTLEVEPHVNTRGDSIRIDVVSQRVELLGFDSFDAIKTASGRSVKIDQPQFFTSKVNAKVRVQNGQRALIAVHLLAKPENYLEVFILQAWTTPVR